MTVFFSAATLKVDPSVHDVRAEKRARDGGCEETYSRRVRQESEANPRVQELAALLDDRFQLTYRSHTSLEAADRDPQDVVTISVETGDGEIAQSKYAAPQTSWPGRTWKKALQKALDLQEDLRAQGKL